MQVDIAIERSTAVALPVDQVRWLLDDVESTIGRFPTVRRFTRLARDQYVWELQTIGSHYAGIAYDLSWGAQYRRSADGNELSWRPLEGCGNSKMEGAFELKPGAHGTTVVLKVKGRLHDVPVPTLYRVAAAPFINGKFTHLIEVFLERTREALLARAGREPLQEALST